MSIDPEILRAQQDYARRPYLAYVSTRYFSGGFRFHNEAEAIDYIYRQAALARFHNDPLDELCGWRSYVEGPSGKIQARYVLLLEALP